MEDSFDQLMSGLDAEEFDSVTGQLTPRAIEQQQEAVAQRVQEDADKLVSLEKHPGWRLIKEAIENTIKSEQEALLFAGHEATVRMYQAQIRARREFLGWLEIKIAEGKSLLDERNQTGPAFAG